MHKIRHQASIFSPCARLQTSLLDRPTPLMAQTKRPDAGHIPYMLSIKIVKFTFFMPQFLKMCITAYGDFKAI